ncbi:MAG TPA: formyltransferase [Burkholderiales bacterium]|nr:formyltransferase [Burkholderiales bacterium]
MTSAVVFAYHNVGVRCLSVLLDQGVTVPLVITHDDDPQENVWFESVAKLSRLHRIPVITPDDPNAPEVVERIAATQPDFLFSFYYRLMLQSTLLNIPRLGAFNMHGSLLPKYRGRAPVNWAIVKGEKETGATLHQMVEKPDAGGIVDQQAIPILENDIALGVFHKVTLAAEMTLHSALPKLIDGSAKLIPQDTTQSSYYGGRKPADGVIDWRESATNIHNLIRAVAPPYPGASTTIAGQPARILRTLREKQQTAKKGNAYLYVDGNILLASCADGGVLRIVAMELDGDIISAEVFRRRFGVSVTLA